MKHADRRLSRPLSQLRSWLGKPAAITVAATTAAALGLSAPAIASAAVQHATVQHAAVRQAPARHVSHPRASRPNPFARPALPAGQQYVCPAPTRPGQMTCMAIIQAALSAAGRAGKPAAFRGYGPADLRKAYHLTTAAARSGRGTTVAIVDAFSDPKAAADLARYRRHFHLPPCGVKSGCLRIVNQRGRSHPLPIADRDWATEESLDLDMVSAVCPRCHILLVEANFPDASDLGTAVDTAAAMGARYISNSWEGPEFFDLGLFALSGFNHFFNHPGVAIGFSSGDFGYSPGWPGDLQFVTAVGGTSLKRAGNRRGFTESVWGSGSAGAEGTGSGCSAIEAKPSWQRADAVEPAGCLNRTENDVAAVADPNTGVVVFDSFQRPGRLVLGGTSVAAPIVTSVYALAGTPTRHSYPAEYPYLHRRLFDVTSGVNGPCEAVRQYLCHGEKGYDGPTGLGTPDGTTAFTDHGRHRITLTDPGTADARAGRPFSLRITGLDTKPVAALHYGATGLPPGLSIHTVPHSTNATITGTLPSTPGTFTVSVTARDGSATGTTRFRIVTLPSLAAAASTPGPVSPLDNHSLCLDDSGGGTGATVKIQACTSSGGQQWLYQSDRPNGAGALIIDGLCLGLSGRAGNGVLAACDGSKGQQWRPVNDTELRNLATGTCLTGGRAGATTRGSACLFARPQLWTLPAFGLVSGIGGLCLDNPGNGAAPRTAVTVADCADSAEQHWHFGIGHTLISASGRCLAVLSNIPGSPAVLVKCGTKAEEWVPLRTGQLANITTSMCLTDPGGGGAGTALVLQDCYGEPGQIWGLN
jgi:hypothetical protein